MYSLSYTVQPAINSGNYLSIYPNGYKSKNAKDHVSIYLAFVETNSLYVGWEVNTIVSFSHTIIFETNMLCIEDQIGYHQIN